MPGSKDEVKKGTKFKNIEVAFDSVQKAKESAGGGTWEFEAEAASDTVDDDELLGPEDARFYWGSCSQAELHSTRQTRHCLCS